MPKVLAVFHSIFPHDLKLQFSYASCRYFPISFRLESSTITSVGCGSLDSELKSIGAKRISSKCLKVAAVAIAGSLFCWWFVKVGESSTRVLLQFPSRYQRRSLELSILKRQMKLWINKCAEQFITNSDWLFNCQFHQPRTSMNKFLIFNWAKHENVCLWAVSKRIKSNFNELLFAWR